MMRQSVSGLAIRILRNYDAPQRDLGTDEVVLPAKPGPNLLNRGLDVTRRRTIFSFRSLQSRWIAPNDHNGLTKRLITMKLPGPDHPITITANPKRVRVLAGGVVIADTTHALTLKEASYPAVQYVPRGDANLALLTRTDRVTHCPYKGDANYFSINADG